MLKKYLPVTIAIFIFDQLTKFYFYGLLKNKEFNFIEVCGFFNLVTVWNRGVSFGMFHDSPYSPVIFSAVAVLVSGFLLYLLSKTSNKFEALAYAMVIGGALGNFVDRLRFKAVFDFLDFHVLGYHWPAFNVADAAISIGAALLILSLLLDGKKSAKKP